MTANERRTIGVVAVIAILRMLGLFSLLPVLALYVAGFPGATPLLIGAAVGAYGLTQAALQIPMGALSDRIGRRPVILGGLVVFAIGSVIAGLSDTIDGVIAGRLLQGAGAISATLTALIADATREQYRTRSMAIYGVGVGMAFIVAMVFGPWFAAQFGVNSLFAFGFAAAMLGALLLTFLPDVPRHAAVGGDNRWRDAFRPALLRLDFYVLILHTILTASFVALPFLFSSRLQIPLISHWPFYVGAILVSLLGTVPLIMKDERRGRRRTVATAVLLLVVAQLLLTFFGGNAVMAFAGLAVFFAGFNFLEAALPARLSILAPARSRGAALGVFSSCQFLGAFAGGMLGGQFLADGRPANVFFVCALLAGIWLAAEGLGQARNPGHGQARDHAADESDVDRHNAAS